MSKEIRLVRMMTATLAVPEHTEARSAQRFETKKYIEGRAAVFDAPYALFEYGDQVYYERIDAGALEAADISDAVFNYNHGGRVLARTSNNTLALEVTPSGLFVCADLSKSDAARQMYKDIKAGLVTKMSWAFSVRESAFDKKTLTYTITKVGKVYDVSAVAHPANSDTDIAARFAEGFGLHGDSGGVCARCGNVALPYAPDAHHGSANAYHGTNARRICADAERDNTHEVYSKLLALKYKLEALK